MGSEELRQLIQRFEREVQETAAPQTLLRQTCRGSRADRSRPLSAVVGKPSQAISVSLNSAPSCVKRISLSST